MTEESLTELGMMVPDTMRTLLAISANGEIAVSIRDMVDRSYLVVRDVRSHEAEEGFHASLPWPWMVVGTTPTISPAVQRLLSHNPVLIAWYGSELPDGLPAHAVALSTFRELIAYINDRLDAQIAGMHLAIGLGVELPDGQLARSAELQALLSLAPAAFDIPMTAFRSAQRILLAHHIDASVNRDPDTGHVSLIARAGVEV